MEITAVPALLQDIALKVMGGEHVLTLYIKRRKQKAMPRHFLRQMFLVKTKELIAELSPAKLGEICALGQDFNPFDMDDNIEYEDATLNTRGTNAWSGVFLSTADSGLILIQKIAVASILTTIIQMVSYGQPDLGREGWEPWQIWEENENDPDADYGKLVNREKAITDRLGW